MNSKQLQQYLHDQLFEIKDHNILVKFKIDNYSKQCLMNGYDDIDFLLSQRHKIISFEKKRNGKKNCCATR